MYEDYEKGDLRERVINEGDHGAVGELARRTLLGPEKKRDTYSMALSLLTSDRPDIMEQHADTLAYLLLKSNRAEYDLKLVKTDGGVTTYFGADGVGIEISAPGVEEVTDRKTRGLVHSNLTNAVDRILDERPEVFPQVAPALVVETDVPEKVVTDRAQVKELDGVRRALTAWEDAAERGQVIPERVVENAIESIQHFDTLGQLNAVNVLGWAVRNDSPNADLAAAALGQLVACPDKFLRKTAARAVTEAVVESDVELPHPEQFAEWLEVAREIDAVDDEPNREAVEELRQQANPVEGDPEEFFDAGHGIDAAVSPDGLLDRVLHGAGIGWR